VDVDHSVEQQAAPARAGRRQREGEGQLRADATGAGDPARQSALAKARDHVAQVSHLLGQHDGAMTLDQRCNLRLGGNQWTCEVEVLEQLVNECAAQQRTQARSVVKGLGRRRRIDPREPQRAFQIEAVGAAPVGLERRVGEATDGQRPGRRQRRQAELRLGVAGGLRRLGRDGAAVGGGQELLDVRRA
jgi:hypothetical protein